MINKRGQAFVFLIIFIPVMVTFFVGCINLSSTLYQKEKIHSLTRTIIKNCFEDCSKDDIIELYNKNGVKIDNLEVNKTDNLNLVFDYKIDKNSIKVDITGCKENNKIIFKKGC